MIGDENVKVQQHTEQEKKAIQEARDELLKPEKVSNVMLDTETS